MNCNSLMWSNLDKDRGVAPLHCGRHFSTLDQLQIVNKKCTIGHPKFGHHLSLYGWCTLYTSIWQHYCFSKTQTSYTLSVGNPSVWCTNIIQAFLTNFHKSRAHNSTKCCWYFKIGNGIELISKAKEHCNGSRRV